MLRVLPLLPHRAHICAGFPELKNHHGAREPASRLLAGRFTKRGQVLRTLAVLKCARWAGPTADVQNSQSQAEEFPLVCGPVSGNGAGFLTGIVSHWSDSRIEIRASGHHVLGSRS